jgi:hypothetical protein
MVFIMIRTENEMGNVGESQPPPRYFSWKHISGLPTRAGQTPKATVAPVADRVVLFWSDYRVPHEVLQSHAERFTVTIWFFDALEWSDLPSLPRCCLALHEPARGQMSAHSSALCLPACLSTAVLVGGWMMVGGGGWAAAITKCGIVGKS